MASEKFGQDRWLSPRGNIARNVVIIFSYRYSRLRPMLPAERFHPPPREYLGRCRPKFSDPRRSWDVHRSATGRSRLSLLITALTYIRGACVAAEAAIHGERHACVESDSAPKKRNIASRARRDHLSLRSSRRAHERSWNTRCSLHAYLLELSPSTRNRAFLNISRCLSTRRLPAAILFPPSRSGCVLLSTKQHSVLPPSRT